MIFPLAWFFVTCLLPLIIAVIKKHNNIWLIGFCCVVAAFACAPVGLLALYKALAYNTKYDIVFNNKGSRNGK